jgi:hypothetical protein
LHYKKWEENPRQKTDLLSKYKVNQVFKTQEEDVLEKYIIQCSRMKYWLNYTEIHQLAFDHAKKLDCCPQKLQEVGTAGLKSVKCFTKCQPHLSLRKPENTSLARVTSFKQMTVTDFYSNYRELLVKFEFTGEQIYNLNETGVTTVVQASHTADQTGVKQVGHVVSAQKGQLITVCAIINATGNTVPPVLVFPHARMHDAQMINAPEGSSGLVNCPTSGWMTGPLFLKVLEHIKKNTHCNKEEAILVLLNNHKSHCTFDAVLYCRENGIVMCTFPPHCTQQLQPLDVAVTGPFKTKVA